MWLFAEVPLITKNVRDEPEFLCFHTLYWFCGTHCQCTWTVCPDDVAFTEAQ